MFLSILCDGRAAAGRFEADDPQAGQGDLYWLERSFSVIGQTSDSACTGGGSPIVSGRARNALAWRSAASIRSRMEGASALVALMLLRRPPPR